ncbi:PAS domain-containing sensor histidine kinase [Pedobacter heparinus]|uniref:PAS domain-containing sensor histidine kinase n=1 Tax=Pedobacter heparinus TaxID=984 RepID=UPI00292D4003|nr:PAS domain-containing sensor histidine kinase [Pedobacter heparinus]
MSDDQFSHLTPAAEDFDDFFDTALCGFVITDREGKIIRINQRLAGWLNSAADQFKGKRFSDLLAIGGRIYFETHLWPLLRMQGYFEEVAVELMETGNGKMPVFINGYERKDENEQLLFTRFTLFRGTDRRLYEQNLQSSKKLAEDNLSAEQQNAVIREQFIAVLGHDLRNPLGGIMSAAQMLARTDLGKNEERLTRILLSSSKRMHEMIDNIMDLARGRLGGGIPISPVTVNLQDLLNQVTDELKIAWPESKIETDFSISQPVVCDPGRIAQLSSNLLANAITHGSADTPVQISAASNENFWCISITNQGKPIPQHTIGNLFHPFHRAESHASQNGLGLGLYIASEIAKAHHGTLKVNSDENETNFTFQVINAVS